MFRDWVHVSHVNQSAPGTLLHENIMPGTMNGSPLSMGNDLPPETTALTESFADVDRACTRWLMEHDAIFRRERDYYDRSENRKKNKREALLG